MKVHWQYIAWPLILLLFGLHQVLQKIMGIHLSFFDAYLDPFCAGALALYLAAFERKRIYQQPALGWLDIVVITLLVMLVSEGLLPLLSHSFVADWKDCLAILAGMLWFVSISILSNRAVRKVPQAGVSSSL